MAIDQNKKTKPRKYPGFHPCFNHDLFEELRKNEVPEICRSCYTFFAKHQIQIAALHHAQIVLLQRRVHELSEEINHMRGFVKQIIETGP